MAQQSQGAIYILSPSPSANRRPRAKGEGLNLDRHLVPYHGKQGESNLASSLFTPFALH